MNNSRYVLPFEKQVLLRSQDVCEAKELINSLFEEREFSALTPNRGKDILFTSQALGKTNLMACHWGRNILAKSVSLNNYFLIIPLAGQVYSYRSDRSITKGEAYIFSPGSHTDLIWSSDARAVVIDFDLGSLNEYFNLQGDIPTTGKEIVLTQRKDSDANLFNILNCIIQDDRAGCPLLRSERAQKHWEQLLFESLTLSLPELERSLSQTVLPHHLKQSLEFIQENLHRKITMQDLVELTGSSRRSLESAFRKNFETSPMKYVTQKKLETVREVLLKANPEEVSISEVAERFGFAHASHFCSLYQRSYFEKPSETLKQTH